MTKPVVLCVLDGWGYRPDGKGNAIFQAKTPAMDRLFTSYPHSLLQASEGYVGLPEGQMGNSEVGHTNLGAGRVVLQDLPKINKAVAADGI
jgi:2,3-bisphosphoglycerate-independent phosphoglycerate mutase